MGENFQKNLELVDAVRSMAESKGVTPAQLALSWLLHRGDHIIAIPGTTKQHRFDENIGANNVQLTTEDLAFLDENLPVGAASGDRY